MSILARLLVRTLGPVVMLAVFGTLLAPAMDQPSRIYVTADVSQLVGRQLWPTLTVIALAVVLATAIWLPLAAFTARRGYRAGLTAAPVSVLAQAMAPFWLAVVGLLLVGAPARTGTGTGGASLAQAILPASALAVVLLGFLAYATYLRAIGRQSLAAESDEAHVPTGDLRLEVVEDWLDTLGRQAGLLVGALVLIESVCHWPGLGSFFVNGLVNADAAVRSVALFDLVALSATLTVACGIGAELVRSRLEDRHTPGHMLPALSPIPRVWPLAPTLPEPRWLAVLSVALGGLILVVLLMLATSADGHTLAARPDAVLLPPGVSGHTFGTDQLGRDMHARIAAGLHESFWQLFWLLFTAAFAVPFGLMAARLGRVVEGALGMLLDGLVTVAPLFLVVVWLVSEPRGTGAPVFVGYAMGPLLVRLIRDAVRAAWPGERRDARAAFGAVLMGLLVGMSYAVLLDASLGFLGLAMARVPAQNLGEMVASGNLALARAPWLVVYPGIVLTALASSLILIGYGTLGLSRSRRADAMTYIEDTRQLART